jgi:hypothetical protein
MTKAIVKDDRTKRREAYVKKANGTVKKESKVEETEEFHHRKVTGITVVMLGKFGRKSTAQCPLKCLAVQRRNPCGAVQYGGQHPWRRSQLGGRQPSHKNPLPNCRCLKERTSLLGKASTVVIPCFFQGDPISKS